MTLYFIQRKGCWHRSLVLCGRQETFIAPGRLFLTHSLKKFNVPRLKLFQIRGERKGKDGVKYVGHIICTNKKPANNTCGQAMFLGRFGVYYRVFWRVMRLSAPDWWSPICLHHSINTQLPRAATVVEINKSYFLVPMILCSSLKVPSPLYSGPRCQKVKGQFTESGSRGCRNCQPPHCCWAFQQFQIPSHLSFTSSAVVVSWCQRHLEITSVPGELCWEMPKLR